MKYLVTGGAGFIGSNIVKELLKRGEKVRVLDNFATDKRENLFEFRSNPNFELMEGDLRSFHIVRNAVKGVDYILHQGALPSVPRSINDPITTNDVNILGTLNILEAAKESGVKRVVYASSSSIYRNFDILPKVEEIYNRPDVPQLSLDYAYDEERGYLIEFQTIHFGTSTLEFCDDYYTKKDDEWIVEPQMFDQQEEYVW